MPWGWGWGVLVGKGSQVEPMPRGSMVGDVMSGLDWVQNIILAI